MSSYRSVVAGLGSYLPDQIVTNYDLEKKLDTSHDWIVSRSGIHQRHWADETQVTSDLASIAAQRALKNAGLSADQLDLIIVATTTPDTIFPSVGVVVQRKISAHNAFAFDVQAACSGFVFALATADQYIKSGQVKNALVIGADCMSRLLDPADRTTHVLFGDGAGALVLTQGVLTQDDPDQSRGILSSHLFSDGRLRDLLYVDNGAGQPNPGHGYMRMQGREVYRHAVEKIGDSVVKALEHNHLKVSDISWFVPHQANSRIIKGLCDHFGLPSEKVIMTIAEHGNTSAASIPLALDVGVQKGKIQKNDLVLIEALGGGLTWGSSIMRW